VNIKENSYTVLTLKQLELEHVTKLSDGDVYAYYKNPKSQLEILRDRVEIGLYHSKDHQILSIDTIVRVQAKAITATIDLDGVEFQLWDVEDMRFYDWGY
jgi:hypothetical protein